MQVREGEEKDVFLAGPTGDEDEHYRFTWRALLEDTIMRGEAQRTIFDTKRHRDFPETQWKIPIAYIIPDSDTRWGNLSGNRSRFHYK
jgi:hypothetical protein